MKPTYKLRFDKVNGEYKLWLIKYEYERLKDENIRCIGYVSEPLNITWREMPETPELGTPSFIVTEVDL